MIKKLLFSLVFITISIIINAQDFTLYINDTIVSNDTITKYAELNYTGKYVVEYHLKIKNNSSSMKKYVFTRHNIEQWRLSEHTICDDIACVPSSPTVYANQTHPNGKELLSGYTDEIELHIKFGTKESGHSYEKYTVYELGNESNKIELTVYYKFHNTTNIENNTTAILVSKAFPNPANNSVNFNYNLNTNGYITIHDVTGKQVANIELSEGIDKATFNTSNINDGVYFYNVYIDGVKTTTNKFIIKH